MNCNGAERILGTYADGELQGLRRYALEQHLRRCGQCAAQHREILALRDRLHSELTSFFVPPVLKAQLRARFGDAPARPTARAQAKRDRWQWFTGGALAGGTASVLATMFGAAILTSQAGDELAAEVVASHVQATLDNRLIAVVSSDRHTVKPWLSARLDYSPPVQDLAEEGYKLAGGRLDTLGQRPVATLVYRYQQHTIDVFVRPEPPHSAASSLDTVRGFHVAQATGAGMQWVAVSDVSSDLLSALVQRLAHPDPETEK
jgi:anti-sigma factor RsiW